MDRIRRHYLTESPAEESIFKQHISPHTGILLNSACRLCGNRDDAEDLLQETFFFALKNFSQLRDHAKCKYWLFAILKNLFFKEIYKSRRRVDLEVDLLLSALTDVNGIERDFLKAEVEGNMRKQLGKLEDRLKGPLVLFYYDKLSYKEIADQMNLPIGTVMSRIARAKACLKKEFLRSPEFRVERQGLQEPKKAEKTVE
jgi:RNA polymerase sigma-70 factor (ECF subfamily)